MSKGTFTFSQEVIIAQLDCFVVNVINPKFQFLNHFKVVINNKCLGKYGIQAILNPFCALNLYTTPKQKHFFKSKVNLHFKIFMYYVQLNIGMTSKEVPICLLKILVKDKPAQTLH